MTKQRQRGPVDHDAYSIIVNTLNDLKTPGSRAGFLGTVLDIANKTAPGTLDRIDWIRLASARWLEDAKEEDNEEEGDEENERCTCCGSSLNVVFPCPECGELVCQDCADEVHICEESYSGGYI